MMGGCMTIEQLEQHAADCKDLKKGGRSALTPAILHRFLSYDLSTGIFKWKIAAGKTVKPGDIAGGPTDDGYTGIYIQRRRYGAHRLAWLYVYGEWPAADVDHINRVRADNRIANLRSVTRGENMQNKTPVENKSGVRGVYKNRQKWQASITVNGRFVHIGLFANKADAGLAYIAAKRLYHPNSHEGMEIDSSGECEKFIRDRGQADAYRMCMESAIAERVKHQGKE